MDSYRLKYKIWIENSEGLKLLGDGKLNLLKAIKETGSLKTAIEKVGYTYRTTWNDLKKIEQRLGFPLIKTSRVGANKGSSELTEKGEQLIIIFDSFHADLDSKIEKLSDELNKFKKGFNS